MSNMKNSVAFGEATKELERIGTKEAAVGIDLGTTNSCVAIIQTGKTPKVIPLKNGKPTMPSCIMWKGKKGEFVVGHEAYKNRYKPSAVYSIKRLMGQDTTVTLTYGPKSIEMTPAEVSAEILKGLVEQASSQFKNIKNAIITVPAYFDSAQIKATIEAGKLAGLNVLSTLREPTAAALNYGMENFDKDEENVMVYDLGGGTFDVAVLRITKSAEGEDLSDLSELYGDIPQELSNSMKYTVLDVDGDSQLGGDDMDIELFNIVSGKLRSMGYDPNHLRKEDRENLILRMEELKKRGISTYETTVDFKLTNGTHMKETVMIYAEDFISAARVIYRRTKAKVDAVLNRVGIKDIDSIILVGGSTKSLAIKSQLSKDFPGVVINDALNPDESVALGAAIKAKEEMYGSHDVEVFDVIPQSIGILSDGFVQPLIYRNQRVPYSSTLAFATTSDNQERVRIEVYQGNSSLKEDCSYLGSLLITDIKKAKAGEVTGTVYLVVDSNGQLKCTVSIDGNVKEAELVNLFGRTESKKTLDPKERRIIKWKKFAETLGDEGKAEVLAVVEDFSAGQATTRDVAGIISKYTDTKVEINGPSVNVDTTKYYGEDEE